MKSFVHIIVFIKFNRHLKKSWIRCQMFRETFERMNDETQTPLKRFLRWTHQHLTGNTWKRFFLVLRRTAVILRASLTIYGWSRIKDEPSNLLPVSGRRFLHVMLLKSRTFGRAVLHLLYPHASWRDSNDFKRWENKAPILHLKLNATDNFQRDATERSSSRSWQTVVWVTNGEHSQYTT